MMQASAKESICKATKVENKMKRIFTMKSENVSFWTDNVKRVSSHKWIHKRKLHMESVT